MEVLLTSPWIPPEWIKAHGLDPRGAWFAEAARAGAVPEGVCAFAQRMADLARPFSDAPIVFTTACDQMRRAADAAQADGGPVFLFNLPATWQTPTARRLYHHELARLGRFLESLGGRAPTDAHLVEVIREYEAHREALRMLSSWCEARQLAEALAYYFDGSAQTFPGRNGTAEHPDSLPHQAAAIDQASASRRVPLALVGGPLLPAQWTLFDSIAAAGGQVVLNATEPGERCLLPALPPPFPGQRPLAALADHYFDHAVDVYHRPNSRLYAWLCPRLAERCIRGIVLWAQVACDLWRAEAASLREALGLPVLVVEAHAVHAGGTREATRLAAFIEALHDCMRPSPAGAAEGWGSGSTDTSRTPL